MLNLLIHKYSNRFISRWLILAIDLIVVFFLFLFAYVVRFNFNLDLAKTSFYLWQIPYILGVYAISFLLFQSFSNIIRHTTIQDALKLFYALSLATTIMASITYIVQHYFPGNYLNVPFSIILIHFLLNAFILINTRFFIKLVYLNLVSRVDELEEINVLIYGSGNLGIITKNTLRRSTMNNYKVVGFIDDNPFKQNKIIEGIRIYSPEQVFNQKFIDKEDIKEVIIAIKEITVTKKRHFTDQCLNFNLAVKTVPPVEKWIQNGLSVRQIHEVKIEDLLGRDSIVLDKTTVEKGIKDHVVLITGAAGSIGSEMVRQIMAFQPIKLICIDQAETPLHDLTLEVRTKFPNREIIFKICDINNRGRLRSLFEELKPSIVFHAAAYKHVPMMEDNPYEAARVNIGGTKNLSDLSVEFGVERFVMISTDKAVNPTNVMGATKRVAEMYTRSLNELKHSTIFITTRFGNVLGSNGSVIPLFKKQIEAGGPLTVTHEDITRYFMTIPEACQLVLEAAFLGKTGQIFVFDMGESVKIYDLAKKMVKLAGLQLGKDIDIVFTGLRPGEKLYEELLDGDEITDTTHNPKIMIGNAREFNISELSERVNTLIKNIDEYTDFEIVSQIKAMVPEFVSQNSVYSKLDDHK